MASLEPKWASQIIRYLKNGELPEDKEETKKVKMRVSRYLFLSKILYKRSFTLSLLRYLLEEEVDYMIRETHEGICGSHSRGRSMAHKAIRARYYWSFMQKYVTLLTQRCDKCQRFANVPRKPAEELTPIAGPWPFTQWGIDIVGPLFMGKGQMRFLVVANDYFTKWVEAEPLVKIIEKNIHDFTWESIICRFEILHKDRY